VILRTITLLLLGLAVTDRSPAAGSLSGMVLHGSPDYPLDDRAYPWIFNGVASGALPLDMMTNRPLCRTEAIEEYLTESQRFFTSGYARAWRSRDWHIFNYKLDDGSTLIFDPRFTARVDVSKNKTILRRGSGIQFRGSFKELLGYSFRFTDNTERGNGPYLRRSQLLEDHYGYVGPLQGGKETYYDQTEAYLN
jgi:hypothetical protein